MDTMQNYSVDEVLERIPHAELAELYVELAAVTKDLQQQFEQVFTYATMLEMENKHLLAKLEDSE